MPSDLRVVTVKLPESLLRRIPRGETRSAFIRAAVKEKLSKEDAPPWKPKTATGRKLLALRKRFIARGGQLLDAEGIEQELRERRGGLG